MLFFEFYVISFVSCGTVLSTLVIVVQHTRISLYFSLNKFSPCQYYTIIFFDFCKSSAIMSSVFSFYFHSNFEAIILIYLCLVYFFSVLTMRTSVRSCTCWRHDNGCQWFVVYALDTTSIIIIIDVCAQDGEVFF